VRVLMVCNWQAGGNCDEDAVAHALTELGHTVTRLDESDGRHAPSFEADLCLFFKWRDPATLARIKCPKVFYYFDLIWFRDATIAPRCRGRVQWMREMLPHVDLGFATDGDFCTRVRGGRLVWLPQGADGRILGAGKAGPRRTPILFTGIRNGGQGRASFVDDMQAHYGRDFRHVQSGVYRRELADLIASSDIVVAPDAPVTDRYCSNRIFNVLGFGGFLLHPYCEFLASMYEDRKEVVFYRSREELHGLIQEYRRAGDERRRIAEAGLARTAKDHTYLHRVATMMGVIKERLGLS
jgi:hypothetical protein